MVFSVEEWIFYTALTVNMKREVWKYFATAVQGQRVPLNQHLNWKNLKNRLDYIICSRLGLVLKKKAQYLKVKRRI